MYAPTRGSSLIDGFDQHRLALGELELPPRAGLTVFLAFHHAGVSSEKAVFPHNAPVGLVEGNQRPGKTMANSAGLTFLAAAFYLDLDVELVLAGEGLQRLVYDIGMLSEPEIGLRVLTID